MYQVSDERKKYHELLPSLIKRLAQGVLVYDIGKSHLHEYRSTFQGFQYLTIDRDNGKAPDIIMDIETFRHERMAFDQAEAILCNGVVEQCDDPMEMIRACNRLVVSGGWVLFGMVLLGYPPHQNDRFRFTKTGAESALARYGFRIEETHVLKRNDIPSYIYAICQKIREA